MMAILRMNLGQHTLGMAATLFAVATAGVLFFSKGKALLSKEALQNIQPYLAFWYEKQLLQPYVSNFMLETLLFSDIVGIISVLAILLQNCIFADEFPTYVKPNFSRFLLPQCGGIVFCLLFRYVLIYFVQMKDNGRRVFGPFNAEVDPLLYLTGPYGIILFSLVAGIVCGTLLTAVVFKSVGKI